MLSRREFIKGAGAFALGAPFILGRGVRPGTPSCIVIGAGLSGLAAAYTLINAGWKVQVVEGRSRIGGRVFTHRMAENPDLACELGAEWVGASHERIRDLCRTFGIELHDHRFTTTLLRDGAILPPNEWRFTPAAEAAFEKLRKEYEKYTDRQKRRMDEIDWWTCLERIGFTQDDLRLRDLFDSTDFGESIRHVSAYAAASEYFESSPDNEMDFKMAGGNSRLVEELAARIGAATVLTGQKVDAIIQRRGRVTVTAGSQSWSADACICTVPARMLDAIRFDPPLPAIQAEAARSLQYARIMKSSVLYRERFWKAENFSLLSDVTSHYYFHSTKDQAGSEGILTSYAIGEKADVLAAQSDARRLDLITRDLAPLDRRAPELARGMASYAWQRDPFTEGAYALYRPGQWFGVRPILQRPHAKVLFAGEHLADWQGFMEGAVVTGEEAAKALMD